MNNNELAIWLNKYIYCLNYTNTKTKLLPILLMISENIEKPYKIENKKLSEDSCCK